MIVSRKNIAVVLAFSLATGLSSTTNAALGPRLDRMEKRLSEMQREIEGAREREGILRNTLSFDQRHRS